MNITDDPNIRYIVLTHKPCRDGFVAFICARKYYGDKKVTYEGIDPSDQVNNLDNIISQIPANVTDVNIESFDIAFNPSTIINMITKYSFRFNIKIFDHHKTSIEGWQGERLYEMNSGMNVAYNESNGNILCGIEDGKSVVIFKANLTDCGASLAWKYYFTEPLPLYIEYVRDRDNWLFDTIEAKARNSLIVSEYLNTMCPEYTNINGWIELFDKTKEYFDMAYQTGLVLNTQKERDMNAVMTSGTCRVIDGHNVFICNAVTNISDIGNKACEMFKMVQLNPTDEELTKVYIYDYALIWRYVENVEKYWISLRSRKGGMDVSAIAKKYGGGGHMNASGFTSNSDSFRHSKVSILPVPSVRKEFGGC